MKTLGKIYVRALALSFSVLLSSLLFAQEDEPQLEVNGFVRNYTGLLYNNGDFSILQNTFDLTLKHSRENISFLANPFYYQYPYQDDYFDFRELYMDIYTKKLDLRIGKQQIVWGQADGVFITDIVSPLNLTEFLLWDFNEIRMGVTAVKAKYYPHQDHNIEVVWIPVFTPSILPDSNSIWQPVQEFPAPPTFNYSKADVPLNIENSEIFIRYSLNKSAIDLQLIGAYTWDDTPTMHVQKEFGIDSTTVPPSPYLKGLNITPEHHRLTMVGGNFSSMVQDFILRGEVAYYQGKYFQTTDPLASDALVQKDYVNYVVGLDRTIGTWKLSGQFIQKIILDHSELMTNNDVDNLMTVLVSHTMMRDLIRLELFSYIGLTNEDALIRIRGFYFPYDGLGIELGTNIFVGDQGLFGQYHNNSMIYTRIKYSF